MIEKSLLAIIPTSTRNENVFQVQKAFIQSLIAETDAKQLIIDITENNGDPDLADEWIIYALQYLKYRNVVVNCRKTKEPFNMNKIYNYAYSKNSSFISNSDYVAFMNSDLIFREKWFSRLHSTYSHLGLSSKHKLGTVIPASSAKTFQYNVSTDNGMHTNGPFIIEPDINQMIGQSRYKLLNLEDKEQNPGWLLFMRKDAFESIGPFDENIPGWYQDNDFYRTLQTKGFVSYVDYGTIVDHLEGITFKTLMYEDPDEFTRLTTNKDIVNYYNNKWGQ